MRHVFVSRDDELARLESMLAQAAGGSGQVCFVTGEAGVGKTSLTAEFARRVEEAYPELLVAIGDCNSQTGIGDPYLPFREVLSMLAGDIDDRVAQGMTSEENANRLRGFLNVSKQIIREVGPDLIDIFVPGVAAVSKAGSMLADRRASREAAPDLRETALREAVKDRDQGRIFEQVTRVLVSLAAERPLIIVLDDLHWIDDSSASLLFHLARRIEGSRLLVLGTYRPEEIGVERAGARHPMSRIVPEIKRYYGDVVIELDLGDEAAAQAFVSELLATESVDAGPGFRQRFFEQTRGHPLFAAELLSDMRERGALVEGDDHRWQAAPDLDWTALPARTEGVIEERISRLPAQLQEILTVASVQGEVFTAEVVVTVLGIERRPVLSSLTRELERIHRLVREESPERSGGIRVSQFRFRHQLFQQYLYDRLGRAERELLHEDVANAMEEIYGDQRDAHAIALAFQLDLAGLPERAARYYLVAGRRAVDVYAYHEAAAHAQKGIRVLGDGPADEPELRLDLGLLLGDAELRGGNAGVSMTAYRETAERALAAGRPEIAARAAIGYSEPGWRYNVIDETAADLLGRSLERLGEADSVLRARLMANFARVGQQTGSGGEPLALLAEATAMARRLDNPRALVDCARIRFAMDRDPARIGERLALVEELRHLTAEELDDKALQMESFAFSIYERLALGDIDVCRSHLDDMGRIAAEAGDPFYVYHEATMRVALLILAGSFGEAERRALEAMHRGRELGVTQVEGVMGVQLFTVRREQGRLAEFAAVIRTFLEREGADSAWRPGLALACADVGDLEEARRQFDTLAEGGFAGIARDSLRQTSFAYLAEVCDVLGDADRAEILYRELLPYDGMTLVVGNATACLGASARYLGRIAAVSGRDEQAAEHFRAAMALERKIGAAPWLAHSRCEYARLLAGDGSAASRAEAAGLLDEAEATARELGMAFLLGRIGATRELL